MEWPWWLEGVLGLPWWLWARLFVLYALGTACVARVLWCCTGRVEVGFAAALVAGVTALVLAPWWWQ